jgi:limonene-1,2-epoxide hydrolase
VTYHGVWRSASHVANPGNTRPRDRGEDRPEEGPDGESDNLETIELAAFFTDDAVYHIIPQAPVTGREAIASLIDSLIRPGPPGIESIEFRVINIAANGPIVMTERVDVFRVADKSFELQVMGTFEITDSKINAWRDYFDMNQFTSRME